MAQKTLITIQESPPIKKRADKITIPDLWHIAKNLPAADKKRVLDVWYLCHQLLRHIKK